MKNISEIRTDYTKNSIDVKDLDSNPIGQFKKWFENAQELGVLEVNAMVLSTASKDGVPSGRVLLLKGIVDGGFVFFSNYNSAKGKDLEENPTACMTFFWSELEQQIRVSGAISKLNSKSSTEYFHSRPRKSQISALASAQSEKIMNRSCLEEKVKEIESKYEEKQIPKPKDWGGYILHPNKLEFWQGRSSRLHDRFEYEMIDGCWNIARLSP